MKKKTIPNFPSIFLSSLERNNCDKIFHFGCINWHTLSVSRNNPCVRSIINISNRISDKTKIGLSVSAALTVRFKWMNLKNTFLRLLQFIQFCRTISEECSMCVIGTWGGRTAKNNWRIISRWGHRSWGGQLTRKSISLKIGSEHLNSDSQ